MNKWKIITFLLIISMTVYLYLANVIINSYPIAMKTVNYESRFVAITDDYHLYSAFWETRYETNFVTIIGIMQTNKDVKPRSSNTIPAEKLNIDCYLWYENESLPEIAKISVHLHRLLLNFKFRQSNFKCFPISNHSSVPYAASILPKDSKYYQISKLHTLNKLDYPHKLISVQQFPEMLPMDQTRTTVCVKQFYGPYDDTLSLIQFIMYYKYVLKVERFMFYDLAITKSVRKMIQKLQERGEDITLKPWNLPTGVHLELQDYGSTLAYRDCLYSSMNDFVVIVDIDEFIVPLKRGVQTIPEIYHEALRVTGGKFGNSIIVKCRYFSKDNITSTNKTSLPILYITEGQEVSNDLPKTIAYSKTVEIVGHHSIIKFINESYRNNYCPPEIAIEHHYRKYKNTSHWNSMTETTITTVTQWSYLLYSSDLWRMFINGEL